MLPGGRTPMEQPPNRASIHDRDDFQESLVVQSQNVYFNDRVDEAA